MSLFDLLRAPRTANRPRADLRVDRLEDRCVPSLTGAERIISDAAAPADPGLPAAVSASSRNGYRVVAWVQNGDQFAEEIFAQLYNRDGTKHGKPFRAGATTHGPAQDGVSDGIRDLSARIDTKGRAIVAWSEDYQATGRESFDSYASRYNLLGRRIDYFSWANPVYDETNPSIACAGKDLVITYRVTAYPKGGGPGKSKIRIERYASDTVDKMLLPAIPTIPNATPAVAINSHGIIALAYQTTDSSGSGDVFLNRYTFAGKLLGASAIATTAESEENPSVAIDDAGNAVVAWEVHHDGGHTSVLSREVSAKGVIGPVVTVKASDFGDITDPAVARNLTDGSYVVMYHATGITDTLEAAEVAAGKKKVRHYYTVAKYKVDSPPSVSLDAAGIYLAAWTSADHPREPTTGVFGHFGKLA